MLKITSYFNVNSVSLLYRNLITDSNACVHIIQQKRTSALFTEVILQRPDFSLINKEFLFHTNAAYHCFGTYSVLLISYTT